MAQVSYEVSKQIQNQTSGNSNLPQFFTLKNDGDEAVVRFMHDNTASFDIVVAHQIQTQNGRFRNVNCIRDPREPLDKCPFCKAGMPVRQRFYIHLIAYLKDDNGQIIPTPMIWERSIQYAEKLKSYIDNYGPLSNVICKIIRHGKAGSKETTYEIVPNLSPINYPAEVYPKIEGAFENYHAIGTTVIDKNAQELQYYIDFGVFPEVDAPTSAQSVQSIPPAQPQYIPPTAQPMTNQFSTPFDSSGVVAPTRPIRYTE